VGFSNITLAFYMCEPWSPAEFAQVRKNTLFLFSSHLPMKHDGLPRQARDEPKETLTKKRAFRTDGHCRPGAQNAFFAPFLFKNE